jgi:HK97 family phage portal protein
LFSFRIKNKVNEIVRDKLTEIFRGFGRQSSVPIRNKKEMLKIFHNNPWLFLAIDIISKNVASAELYVEETMPNGDTTDLINHEVLNLLDNPNPLLLGWTTKYIIQALIEITGECVILIDRAENNDIIGLYPITSDNIVTMPFRGFPYWRLKTGEEIKEIYVTEIIYIKQPDLSDIYGRGIGRTQAITDEINIHELSGKQIGQYFFNSAIPEYLIGLENADRTQAERVKESWLNNNQGWVKKYLPHFVSGGFTVQKLQSEFKDMELNNLRKDEKDAIMQFFQIPEELYGKSQNSNRATSEVAESNFAKQVIVPRLDLLILHFNAYLMPEYNKNKNKNIKYKIKYKNIVPRDKEFSLKVKQAFPYAFSLNELRIEAEEEPVEGFDEVFAVPLGIKLKKFDDLTKEEQDIIEALKTNNSIEMLKKKSINKSNIGLGELLRAIEEVDYAVDNNGIFAVYNNLYKKIFEEIAAEIDFTDLSFSVKPSIIAYINNNAGQKIQMITNTLKKDLRNELIEGYNNGESITQIMKRLSDNVFEEKKKGYELERIARTETMQSVNSATLITYQEAGVENKEWIATLDDRTRDSHADMHGQIVGITSFFTSGLGNTTQAPGLFGIAEEDINCRCTIGAVIQTKSYTKEYKKGFAERQDTRATSFEEKFKKAYKKKFQNIQIQINAELNKLE